MEMVKPRFAVVLSGCGVFDGSEIHESVAVLLALSKRGLDYQCFAPDTVQSKVVDHASGQATAISGDAEKLQRSVLTESARIARGDIKSLSSYSANDYDGIVFPGGFGAAMNLCSFASEGPDCSVLPEVKEAIEDNHSIGKPVVALCIAPALIAKVLGRHGVEVTIGNDGATAGGIEKTGAKHIEKNATEVHVDEENRVVSSPCYMLAKSVAEVFEGADNAIEAAIDLLNM